MSEFICPKSGESCDFYSFCASKEEAQGEGGDMADSLIQHLPEAISGPLLEAGYCANERLEALADVAESPETSPEDASAAIMWLARIKTARDLFPTPEPIETA